METLAYLRIAVLATGTAVYFFATALIARRWTKGTFNRLLFFLLLSLLLIYAGGLWEVYVRTRLPLPANAARLVYSSLIAAGLLFLPGLLVHTNLEFFEAERPAIVPAWCKALVLGPLYAAPTISFLAPFWTARPFATGRVRFGPRFGPLDQITPRLLRFFAWTPEATFVFVAILLSLAIQVGILNLRDRRSDDERRFFHATVLIGATAMLLLAAARAYRWFDTVQIEALGVTMIGIGTLPGVLLGYYALRARLGNSASAERLPQAGASSSS